MSGPVDTAIIPRHYCECGHNVNQPSEVFYRCETCLYIYCSKCYDDKTKKPEVEEKES